MTALLVNAGNANCATGQPGIDACKQSCVAVAEQFHCVLDEVFPSSTGIIGVPLPVEKLVAAVPAAKAALGSTPQHAEAFANAILTTDTKLKVARASFEIGGRTVRLRLLQGRGEDRAAGCASCDDAGHLFTDLAACPEHLQAMLTKAVDASFNCISVDGDMSTNDTVLLMASGKSEVAAEGDAVPAFEASLQQVCDSLAHQIVDDGEGVTHVITLKITGAEGDSDAQHVALDRQLAVCKTAWSSADPNWAGCWQRQERQG